jgi:hypothetical protein
VRFFFGDVKEVFDDGKKLIKISNVLHVEIRVK